MKTIEEAAEKYEKNHTYQRYDGGGFTPEYNATLAEAFIAGAKRQMLEDAVERVVKVDAGGYPYIDAMELYDYEKDKPLAKAGDKVKIIIVKEDEQ